jgi:hypothetical protein
MGVKTVGHDPKLGVDINAPYIIWHPQHVEITANEAMQAAEGRTRKCEAKEFLLERLIPNCGDIDSSAPPVRARATHLYPIGPPYIFAMDVSLAAHVA